MLDTNPADLCEPIKAQRATAKGRAPTADELAALFGTDDEDWKVFLQLAAGTGLRRGELTALTWGDVDLENGTVTVSKAMDESGNIKSTTTERTRVVPMGSDLTAVMRTYRARVAEKMIPTEKTRVFDRWTPHSVSIYFRRTTKKLGIKTLGIHGLRHYYAT